MFENKCLLAQFCKQKVIHYGAGQILQLLSNGRAKRSHKCVICIQREITFCVFRNLFSALASGFAKQFFKATTHLLDLIGLNLNVRHLTTYAARRLVHQETCVWEAKTIFFLRTDKDQCARACDHCRVGRVGGARIAQVVFSLSMLAVTLGLTVTLPSGSRSRSSRVMSPVVSPLVWTSLTPAKTW